MLYEVITQLCSIACEGVAEAIGMVKVPEEWKQNKKSIMPQIDYGKCVFCGLCVDACPFYALYMTNDYELSSFSKEGLIYTPAQLAVKPEVAQDSEIQISDRGATHRITSYNVCYTKLLRVICHIQCIKWTSIYA